jgi:hypothetical protein
MVKFLDIVEECKRVEIDCDRCNYQKECHRLAVHLEDASPIMIAELVQENKEF